MNGIRRALVISILSRGWAAALALLAVPLYLRFLGVEAYGVVGLFTSFSVLVGFLDLGLGATLTRELARLSANTITLSESRDLLRTFELVYALIALLIGLLIVLCSVPVAQYWVQAQVLDRSEIAHALALAGVTLACQWPTNLYNAGLAGLHRQAQLGIATMVFATFRVVLTLAAVWEAPSLASFFWAQIASMLLQTLGVRWLLWREMDLVEHRPQLRMSIIRSSLSFAGGMTGIAIASIILTQVDKIVLSNALGLGDFGAYVIASTFASGLYMAISPVFSVMYPRFSHLVSLGDNKQLFQNYHSVSQTLSAMLFPVAALLVFFSKDVLFVWTGDVSLSTESSVILVLLVLGNTFNGIMNMPYALQLAHGWVRLALWINVFGLVFLVPASWLAAKTFGPIGGAAAWLCLNIGYFLVWPSLLQKKLMVKEKMEWYIFDISFPFLSAMMSAWVLSLVRVNLNNMTRVELVFFLLLSWLVVFLVTIGFLSRVKNNIVVAWVGFGNLR